LLSGDGLVEDFAALLVTKYLPFHPFKFINNHQPLPPLVRRKLAPPHDHFCYYATNMSGKLHSDKMTHDRRSHLQPSVTATYDDTGFELNTRSGGVQ